MLAHAAAGRGTRRPHLSRQGCRRPRWTAPRSATLPADSHLERRPSRRPTVCTPGFQPVRPGVGPTVCTPGFQPVRPGVGPTVCTPGFQPVRPGVRPTVCTPGFQPVRPGVRPTWYPRLPAGPSWGGADLDQPAQAGFVAPPRLSPRALDARLPFGLFFLLVLARWFWRQADGGGQAQQALRDQVDLGDLGAGGLAGFLARRHNAARRQIQRGDGGVGLLAERRQPLVIRVGRVERRYRANLERQAGNMPRANINAAWLVRLDGVVNTWRI